MAQSPLTSRVVLRITYIMLNAVYRMEADQAGNRPLHARQPRKLLHQRLDNHANPPGVPKVGMGHHPDFIRPVPFARGPDPHQAILLPHVDRDLPHSQTRRDGLA